MRTKLTLILTALAVGLASLGLIACGDPEESRTAKYERENTEKVMERLRAKVPFPQPADSLELRNLKRRYEFLDNPNQIGYIYLIDHGLIFGNDVVKGKVSSLESQFTNPSQIVCQRMKIANTNDEIHCDVLDQAEPDGSYGRNPAGIFYWDANGVYNEWTGVYRYTSERKEIQQPEQNVVLQSTN